MKSIPFRWLKHCATLIVLVLLVSNCEKEQTFEEEINTDRKVKVVSIDDFKDNVVNNQSYNKLNSLFDSNKVESSSMKRNSEQEYTILTDEITLIELEYATTYTFALKKRNTENNEFYNLIVQIDNNNTIIKSYIIKYNPATKWIKNSNKEYYGDMEIIEDNFLNLSGLFSKAQSSSENETLPPSNLSKNLQLSARGCEPQFYGYWLCNLGNNHAPGEGEKCTSWTYYLEIKTCNTGGVTNGGTNPGTGGEEGNPTDGMGSNSGNGNGSGDSGNGGTPTLPKFPEDGDPPISCPEGTIKDKDGNCVEQPCPGDPVPNPQIAPQHGQSGIKGALHGCTRYGGSCDGPEDRDKQHDGIDIKNQYGKPVFALFDGKIHSNYYQKNKAGYVARIRSELPNGKIIIYQYFHLQRNTRLSVGTEVKAGDIIAYLGDSGNLKGAIEGGGVDSHVHIKMNLYDGTGDSYDYSTNFKNNPINPLDYMNTKFDSEGNKIENNCK